MARSSPPPVALTRLIPEPSSFWTEAAARLVGRSDALWIDLRRRDLGGLEKRIRGERWRSRTPPRSLYLPPTAPEEEADDARLRGWSAGLGLAVVAHRIAASEPAEVGDEPEIWDLLDLLIKGWGGADALDWKTVVPPGAVCLWPLVSGLTDAAELVESRLDDLAGATVRSVVPIVPRLSPKARRRLTEAAGDDVYGTLFHAGEADAHRLAAACRSRGIDFLPPRFHPPGGADVSGRLERKIAAELALIGDLALEVGGAEARVQSLYAAARWFETSRFDTRDLWREGNLDLVPWMNDEIASVVGELVAGAPRSALLELLADRWAGGEKPVPGEADRNETPEES